MPRDITPKNINLKPRDVIAKLSEASIEKPVADLNITLSKEQINAIIREVIGGKGEKLNPVALATDYCCVDASVGSSVAGPVSSVASSVSIPNPENILGLANKTEMLKRELQQKLDVNKTKIGVNVPTNVNIK